MTAAEQRNAAKAFAEEWKGRGDEKGETARFWIELLENVFGVKNAAAGFIKFEERVKDASAGDRVPPVSSPPAFPPRPSSSGKCDGSGIMETAGISIGMEQSDCLVSDSAVIPGDKMKRKERDYG